MRPRSLRPRCGGVASAEAPPYPTCYFQPLAKDDAYSTNQDQTLDVSAPGVLGNDVVFPGRSATVVLVSGPSHGSLTINSNGSFAYAPNPGFLGTDSFTYKANDGANDSNVATVTSRSIRCGRATISATVGTITTIITS